MIVHHTKDFKFKEGELAGGIGRSEKNLAAMARREKANTVAIKIDNGKQVFRMEHAIEEARKEREFKRKMSAQVAGLVEEIRKKGEVKWAMKSEQCGLLLEALTKDSGISYVKKGKSFIFTCQESVSRQHDYDSQLAS